MFVFLKFDLSEPVLIYGLDYDFCVCFCRIKLFHMIKFPKALGKKFFASIQNKVIDYRFQRFFFIPIYIIFGHLKQDKINTKAGGHHYSVYFRC